jgi:hypothetical protein
LGLLDQILSYIIGLNTSVGTLAILVRGKVQAIMIRLAIGSDSIYTEMMHCGGQSIYMLLHDLKRLNGNDDQLSVYYGQTVLVDASDYVWYLLLLHAF